MADFLSAVRWATAGWRVRRVIPGRVSHSWSARELDMATSLGIPDFLADDWEVVK